MIALKKYMKTLFNGFIKENPVLVLLLGTCPTLAMTVNVENALGMAAATALTLMLTNVIISALRKVIPDKVRLPSYIVVIAGTVTIVELLCKAYAYDIYQALGIYLPLITVNCIILARAEMFASKNSIGQSFFDGLGMGIGFMIALFLISSIREIMARGTWLGININFTGDFLTPATIFAMPPGAFFVFGVVVAIVNKISKGRILKNKTNLGCDGCPSAGSCAHNCNEEEANS